YKTYYAFATGKAIPKPKYVRRTTKEKTEQAPKDPTGKRIKSTTKVSRSGKKKQLIKGLENLSEIALSEAEQMKLAIERSKTQLHSSQPNGSGAHEGTGVTPGVLDVPTYGSDNEQISWKSSDEEDDDEANINKEDDDIADDDDVYNVGDLDQEDDNEQTESDNDDDDFVHPKMSTFDEEERQYEEDKEEEDSDLRLKDAVDVVVQLQSNKLREEAQAENDEFLNKIDSNINAIIKDQVKGAEVLVRSTNQPQTSYAVAASLLKLELKKILIDKMDENKSLNRSKVQRNLYNALIESYNSEKYLFTKTFLHHIEILSRLKDVEMMRMKTKNPLLDQTGGTREEELEKNMSQLSTGKFSQAEETIHADEDAHIHEEPAHHEFDIGFTEDQPIDDTIQLPDCTLDRNEDPRKSFDELMDTPLDFSAFVLNQLKVDTLTPELLAGPTFELRKGRKRQQFYGFEVNMESAHDVYSRHRIIDITKLEIVKWHNYKHLDWITVRRDDDKLYTFKEGDYKRLRL
ncbi:hypothetical protein Tco_0980319, partial [Tanacetum coccineum]